MQIRWARFFFVLLFVTLVNAGEALDAISFGSLQIKPDLLLVMLIYISVNSLSGDAILASFAIGFAADISGETMGPYMISYGVLGSFLCQLQKVVAVRKITHQVAAIFFAGLLTGSLGQLLLYFKTSEPASNFFRMVSGVSLYSCLIGPLVWLIFMAFSMLTDVRQGPYRRMIDR